MQLPFAKYQAIGNDFILINNFDNLFRYTPTLVQQLCHRQFGIGADGIVTIEKKEGYDFSILHYNADGSRGGGFCGNGTRCALHYAIHLGLVQQEAFFVAFDGIHTGYLRNDLIHLKLKDIDHAIQPLYTGYFINNGTNHYVEIVSNVAQVNMMTMGLAKRKMVPFEKEGVNLSFVQLMHDSIFVRTCECGLEYEPLSCGTGAVASALIASSYYGLKSPVKVVTKGGDCSVTFTSLPDGKFKDIYLNGPVYQVFQGIIRLD
ncbi:diaminopimelate epimerase [Candidatus Cardinium hertigii]|uniref:Diaminopimelate epimerase n=1 Tax=Candidatus Cardinium hertigii TaxID=247481 RepID=A0A2Z3L8G6_9BACT|nr:diaminopimelate epimerase [Candidatus Cardinium hertigii]AWN81721.1 Diaminopimelate epimerase [Candidatus Cardinium hertigii]